MHKTSHIGARALAVVGLLILCSRVPGTKAILDRPFQRLIDKEDRKPFIYIYELPELFNTGLHRYNGSRDAPDIEAYSADRELHEYLLNHPARIEDPCLATLYFIPVYTSYMVQADWHGGELTFKEECRNDGLRCSYVDTAIAQAIALVRNNFPFWNESRGANHFMVFPTEHGICDGMARLVATGESEQMFGLQTQGEWARDFYAGLPRMPSAPGPPPMACFRPGMDVVIPPMVFNGSNLKPVSPLAHERNISVLLRHDDRGPHFGRVRPLLISHFQNVSANFTGLGRVAAGLAEPAATHAEMANAVFCVCPPGAAAWTARAFQAIFAGCIPVFVFSEAAQPYESAGLNWDSFSVEFSLEVALNDTQQMSARLRDLLLQPPLIQRLQHGLAAVQRGLADWDRKAEDGVQASIVKLLADRAHPMGQFKHHRHRCDMHRAVDAFRAASTAADTRLAHYHAAHPVAVAKHLFPEILGDVEAPIALAMPEEYMPPYRQR